MTAHLTTAPASHLSYFPDNPLTPAKSTDLCLIFPGLPENVTSDRNANTKKQTGYCSPPTISNSRNCG